MLTGRCLTGRISPFSLMACLVALLCATLQALADEPFVLVPAPGKVVIDGKADDWDLSGAYGPVSFDSEFLGKYDATFYGMYDSSNLYLFFHVHDQTPLVNKGIVEEGNYWWGDSIEVRFSLNAADGVPPKQNSADIRHFALWYNDVRQKPQYYLRATMQYTPMVPTGMQVAFRKWADGQGWDCEMACPWSTLSKTVKPKAGDQLGWCMAVLFGNQAGTGFWRKANVLSGEINYQDTSEWHSGGAYLSPSGHVPPNPNTRTQPPGMEPTAPPVTSIDYTLPRAGNVSLAIYRADGRLVRTLLAAQPQLAGAQHAAWDGYDDNGTPLPPGDYTWKAAVGDGVKAVYVMGALNGGSPKYRTPDGRGSWGGIWGNVIATAADRTGVYALWVMEEGEGVLVKMTPEGQVIWKQHVPQALTSSQSALATDGTWVVMASGKGVWRVRAENGDYAPFTAKDAFFHLEPSKAWLDMKPEERLTQAPELQRLPSLRGGDLHLTGIALADDRIYLSRVLENTVEVYRMSTLEKVGQLSVPRPFGLALHAGKLYVVSGAQVLRFDAATLAPAPEGAAIRNGLSMPYGLAVDEWGQCWVTDLGDAQQVKRFAADGSLIAAYGTKGGRPLAGGHFVKTDFRYPTGICVEPHTGQVFFGEDIAPKRLVALDSAGRFVREWLGPFYWGGAGFVVDTRHEPMQLYAFPGNSIIRLNINLREGTEELDAVWPQVEFRGADGGQLLYYWVRCPGLAYHDGTPYLCIAGHDVSIFKVDGYRLLPSAFVSGLRFGKITTLAQTQGAAGVTWHDANDNGVVDVDELKVSKQFNAPYPMPYWGPVVYENFDIVSSGAEGISRLPCLGFDAHGNPLYALDHVQTLLSKFPLSVSDPIAQVDAEGNLYYNRWRYAGAGEQPKGIDWAARITHNGIVKLNAKGEVQWEVLQKAEAFRKPWQSYAIQAIDRPTHGVVLGDDCVSGQTYVVSSDGLVLGAIFEETVRGPAPSPYTLYVEHFTSYHFTDPRDDALYELTGSDDIRIVRITGLESYQRLQGMVSFTAPPKPRVAPGATGVKIAHAARLAAPPKIGGVPDAWQDVPVQSLAVGKPGEEMSATFQLGYTATTLYAAFHVVDSSPMLNSGKVLDSLFKYGDALDLYLACDAHADPARKEPAPGDVRLLLTKYQGKPIVMIYRARAPGTRHPVTFTSGVGKYVVDVVEPLQEATLAFKLDADGKGYTAALAVPFSALAPLKPSPGHRIGFDAGVIFSDAAGQFNAAKAYWTGRAAMARDIPTEAAFFQEQWGVLEFQ